MPSPVRCPPPSPGSPDRVGCAGWRAWRRGSSGSCGWATIQRQHSSTRSKGSAGNEEGKLPIRGRQQLEAAVHLGCIGTWLAGHARERPHATAWRNQGWPKGRGRWQRGRRGGRRVVHGVDLSHAAGQVAQEPGADLGVDALAGGEEPRHLVHALAEAGPVLAQYCGVCAQGSCGRREAHSSQQAARPTSIASHSPSELGIPMGKAAPLAVCLVFPCTKNLDGEHSLSATKSTSTRDPDGEWASPKNFLMSLYTRDPGWRHSLSSSSCASHTPKTDPCAEHSSASTGDSTWDRSPPSALQYQKCTNNKMTFPASPYWGYY